MKNLFTNSSCTIHFNAVTKVLQVPDDHGRIEELHVYGIEAPQRIDGIYWLVTEGVYEFLESYQVWLQSARKDESDNVHECLLA